VIKEDALYKLLTWKRINGKTTSYAISDDTLLKYQKFSGDMGSFRKIKVLKEIIQLPGIILVFGGIVAFASISKKGSIKIFLIHDIQCAEFYKFFFLELWERL